MNHHLSRGRVAGSLALLLLLAPGRAAWSAHPIPLTGQGPRTSISFILDDGSVEASFGLNANWSSFPSIYLNRFSPAAGSFPLVLTQIQILFPSPTLAQRDLTGLPVDLLVYEDTSSSGDPANATRLYQHTFPIPVADGATFAIFPVSILVDTPGDVYIGFTDTFNRLNGTPINYPAPLDRSASQQRSWVASNANGLDPDYTDLGANNILNLIDNVVSYLAGNWTIRARGTTGPLPTATRTATPPARTFTPTRTPTPAPPMVLYDQYDHISINATNSQHYEPALASYDDFLADDFLVGPGETWRVSEVDIAGRVAGNGPVESFNVIFYQPAPSVSGTEVYTAANLGYTTPSTGEFAIALPTPALLGPGPYWLMVQANLGYYTGGGQFGWYNRGARSYQVAAWYNPGDGWGTSCNDSWGMRFSCQGDLPNPDQVFRLVGTGGGGLTATPTPGPPAPSATRTPTPPTTPTATSTLAPKGTLTATPIPTATGTPSPKSTPPTGTPTSMPSPSPTRTIPVPYTPTPTAAPPTATPTACAIRFRDVETGSPFYGFVTTLACRGIVGGYADGTYRPGNPVTRGQLAKFVSNAAGYTDLIPATRQTFGDVPTTHPFWLWIERVAAHGVVGGYADGTFRPHNVVTRGQVAKFASNAAGFIDAIPANRWTFTDVPATHPFWLWIERVAVHSVVGGYEDGSFRPGAAVTRGQTAKFIANAFYP